MGKMHIKGKEAFQRSSGAGAAFAKMMRAGSFEKAIVYVEGDSDTAFYKWLTDKKYVDIQYMVGKDAAISAVQKSKKRGVLALVDSDFDNILNINYDDNIIKTDTHDIETMMIKEDAFKYAKERYIDVTKVNNSQFTEESIWELVIDFATRIGKVRLLSVKNNWNLKFKDDKGKDVLEYDKIIIYKNDEIDIDIRQYIWECINLSDSCDVEVATVFQQYKEDNETYDTWQICRGHDLSLLISIFYSKEMFGKKFIHRDTVEDLMASTYIASRKFKKSQMKNEIMKWQEDNKGWKILSDELM